jgi:hypothetical protein
MSTSPVQPSPLAAAVIALLQGHAAAVGPPAAPANRGPIAPAAAMPGTGKPATAVDPGGARPLPRGSLVNIVA